MVKRHFTLEKARILGDNLAVDWARVDLENFRLGLNIEFDRSLKSQDAIISEEDPFLAGRLVIRRLRESPDFYPRLAQLDRGSDALI